jgi:hypothetical protein
MLWKGTHHNTDICLALSFSMEMKKRKLNIDLFEKYQDMIN